MNRPNFIVAGAPKCGTTALCEYLSEHPQVFISNLKEPHYFAEDFPGYQVPKNEKQYLDLFYQADQTHKAIGEGSVFSLYSDVALKNIHKFDSEMKIIAMLRNPIDLAYSFHSQLVYGMHEDVEDFHQALELQEARKRGEYIPNGSKENRLLQYVEISKLGDQIEKLKSIFPAEQIMIIFFEDFIKDTPGKYQEVLKFLDIDLDSRVDFEKVNVNKKIRFKSLAKTLSPLLKIQNKVLTQSGIQKYLPRGINRFNFLAHLHLMNTQPFKRRELKEETREMLIKAFQSDVQKLANLTERNLDHWLVVDSVSKAAS